MSNKIKVVKYDPKHLEQIELKENYHAGDCPKTVLTTAFTFFCGDTVIAIIGGFPFVPGVIHFWAFISKHVRKCPIAFHKECAKVLDWYEETEKPRRLQWEVRCDYPMGQKWAEALGMVQEGILHAWNSDGSDSYMYGRVNKCLK